MAQIATEWDIWNAGLIAEGVAAGRAEYARNFAEACQALNQRWQQMHGDDDKRRSERPAYDPVHARLERLERFGG